MPSPLAFSDASSAALAARAKLLAHFVEEQAPGDRLIRNKDRFWRYRPYEGGEPATAIDWRQSGKTDKLFVREREAPARLRLRLWAESGEEDLLCLLLALAWLALEGGAEVGWLDPALPFVRGLGRLDFLAFQRPAPAALPPLMPATEDTTIVIASVFAAPEAWLPLLSAYAAQRARFALMALGEGGQALEARAAAEGWPFLRHRPQAPAASTLLTLFEAVRAAALARYNAQTL
jgi:uncharacterized protein (DUF58 family)